MVDKDSSRLSGPKWAVLKPLARAMRRGPTPAEALLWACLRNSQLGAKFRRQHALGPFILDFYCARYDLAIEVDGTIHRFSQQQDRERADFLTDLGITLLRFTNDQVEVDIERVIERIRDAMK